MRKILFSLCIALAVLSCSGDYDDLPYLDDNAAYMLAISVNPSEGGSVSCNNSSNCNQLKYDTFARVTASPSVGYRFVKWSGASSSTWPSIIIKMDGNKTLTAEFERVYTLTTSVSPSGGGSVSPSSSSYTPGTVVTVTATPSTGYRFVRWSGASTSTNTSVTITMNGDRMLTAEFESVGTLGVSVTYGGETYHTVVIGTQTWFARNLNYDVSGSVCYNNNTSNCNTYGRLYDWATAMNLSSSCNSSTCSGQVNTKHQGICPSGWHIPSDGEWSTLISYVGGYSTAGTKLKATSGWYNSGNGEDTYGFARRRRRFRWQFRPFRQCWHQRRLVECHRVPC